MSEDFPVPGGLAAGSRVGSYRVEQALGAGGMAVVYRARDERLGRLVALKVLAPALAADEEFRRRFTAESRAAAAVDHPHIIPIYEAGQAGLALFIAMRLVTGGDLRGVLAREGPLPPERAAQFLSPVASALDAAHRAGLVHRDVKPANVLVDTDPNRPEHVYLSDFGISKGAASSAALTGSGQYLGTPEYTSPEQAKGLAVDGRADQYALACVAWQLLTGTVPFQRDQGLAVLFAHLHEPLPPLDTVRPGLPAAAGQVLARAMAKEPAERYGSCGEFTDALRDALALPAYRPAPPGPGPDASPAPPTRWRRYLTFTLAGMLLVAGTAISLLLATSGAPKLPARPPAATPAAAAPAASKKAMQPAASPGPPAGTLTAILTDADSKGVRAVAFGSDSTLAAGDANGRIYLWNAATGKLTGYLNDPASKGVNAVAFGPGGTILAVGDANGSTYLWDAVTRKLTATLSDPTGTPVNAVAFGPATTLAASDASGRVYLWDTATGEIAGFLIASPGDGMSAMAFGSANTLAVGDFNGITYLIDTALMGKASTPAIMDPYSSAVRAVAFGPGGTTLATGDAKGRAYLWSNATQRFTGFITDPASIFTDPASKGVNAVAFGLAGTTLAAGDANGSTYLWDSGMEEVLIGTLTDPVSKGVSSVAFGPDRTLATSDENGRIYLWRITGRRL